MLLKAFKDTDKRIAEDKRVTPAYLVAVLLWWLLARKEQLTRVAAAYGCD